MSKLYNALRARVNALDNDKDTPLKVGCVLCRRKERLVNFSQIKCGDHICMNGQYFQFNVGDRKIVPYNHHAIVKSVEIVDQGGSAGSTAILTLIHVYAKLSDLSIEIKETNELLDLRNKDIYIIRYRHPTHPPETIIERAESLIGKNKDAKYSLLSCNCEHFCNWCCVGTEESYQAESARKVIVSILAGGASVASKLLRFLMKVFVLSIEDISAVARGCCSALPWTVLGGFAIFYLVYTIYRHSKLNKEVTKGRICSVCCLRQKQELWMRFAVYCVTQAGGITLLSLLIAISASKGLLAGVILVCSILSLACIVYVPKLREKLCSPFRGRLVKVRSLENIWIGDVISFDHWKKSHDGVVSAVKIYPRTRKKKGKVKVIHYSLPSLFERRTIVEEDVEIDLGQDLIFGHDYQQYKVHEPEIVVERARARLGEKKFGVLTNRSCHFCHWAKLDEDVNDEEESTLTNTVFEYMRDWDPRETISQVPAMSIHIDHTRGKKHASKLLSGDWARIKDDIRAGQIIEFKYHGFWHKAVAVEVNTGTKVPSKVTVLVVHYGRNKRVCEEEFRFDLRYDDVWIYKYHPAFRHKKEAIIRRARARLGEERYSLFKHRSSHLVKEIVCKHGSERISTLSEVKPGDIVCFYYWLFKHEGVVTDIQRGDSKEDVVGKITVVHYALDHLIAKRTVKEETMKVDLREDEWHLKSYGDDIAYPASVVVKRARSRVGEQRFSILGNTSFDLVHWAKVVQQPAVIAKISSEGHQENTAGLEDERCLLVPSAGSKKEEFQRFLVHSWSDLIPGIIVEYKYYLIWHQGILSAADEKAGIIKVIHYGANHLFAKRTIMEDTLKLNLKSSGIWMYRGHPRRCNKSAVVLKNARARLGEQRWEKGNRSWDFCKACVLRVVDV